MQLQRWRTVNRRFFEAGAGPSEKEWRQLIRDGVINGRILGPNTFVDTDQLAANTELAAPEKEIPDLLG